MKVGNAVKVEPVGVSCSEDTAASVHLGATEKTSPSYSWLRTL
jgi:hypothetical protein